MKRLQMLLCMGMILGMAAFANAAPFVDVVQTPTGYFVPTDAQKYDAPYYRYKGADWGWTQGAIAGSFSTASLSISAFDVDNLGPGSGYEHDYIYAYDAQSTSWVKIGELAGANDIWSYTTFALNLSTFADDIANGLQVKIEIDQTNTGKWAVTLAKSVLSVDNGTLPPPPPGAAVPEPATLLLLGIGLIGLAGYGRKKFN